LVLLFSLFFNSCKKNKESSALNIQKTSSDYDFFYEKCTSTDGDVDLSCMLGAKMPLFKAKTMNGNLVSTESLMGRVVVLNFWAIHCKPCIAEIPGLNDLVEMYQKKDVVFLAIAGNTNEQLKLWGCSS
jgi:thiol-disulfide isomerase/thioredoxin